MSEKIIKAGLGMGLAMGAQRQEVLNEILQRIEDFKKELEETLGIEVKITLSIDIVERKGK